MFAPTRVRTFPLSPMLGLIKHLFRHLGPEINWDTVANVHAAGCETK